MQVKKQQLESEQQTVSKLGKENVKAVYCPLAYLTYAEPPATEAGGGTPCLHLGGRRAQRPCEDSPQPRAPGGAHRTRAPQRGD